MFKIKFSEDMAKQMKKPENPFQLKRETYMYGIIKYESGSMNSPLE